MKILFFLDFFGFITFYGFEGVVSFKKVKP
jgi:hypothetical protein